MNGSLLEAHDEIVKLLKQIQKSVVVGAPRAFYPATEARVMLDMSKAKLYWLQRQGRIEMFKIDGKMYYTHNSIMKLAFGEDWRKYAPAFDEPSVAELL